MRSINIPGFGNAETIYEVLSGIVSQMLSEALEKQGFTNYKGDYSADNPLYFVEISEGNLFAQLSLNDKYQLTIYAEKYLDEESDERVPFTREVDLGGGSAMYSTFPDIQRELDQQIAEFAAFANS